MADRRRIVTMGRGGQVSVVLDLEDGTLLRSERDTFSVNPGAPKPIMAERLRRFGGSRKVGESHDNGTIAWTAHMIGATADQALSTGDNLFAVLRDPRQDLFFEWRVEGASQSTFYEVRGPASFQLTYRWIVFQSNKWWKTTVEIPVAPLALMLPMDVSDDFSGNTIADYTFDSGAAGNVSITGGQVTAVANLTTEDRAVHACGGYSVLDAQGTVKATPGTTITSFKAGVILRRSASNTYIVIYVDDNATNSRLRIDKVVGGSTTNLASTNLIARAVAGVPLWVRGRVEGARILAEAHSVAPGPQSPPAQIAAYIMNATDAGQLPAGRGGWAWTPQQASALLDDFEYLPYTYSPFDFVAQIPAVVSDDFSTNTIANYTSDGVSTFSVSGGQLVPAATTEIAYTLTTPATALEDAQATLKYTLNVTVPGAGATVGVRAKWIDASNYLMAVVDVQAGTLKLNKKVAGVLSQIGPTASTFSHTLSTAFSYWVRIRVRGSMVVGEWFWNNNKPPDYGGVPDACVSYLLSATEGATFGAGVTGRGGMRTITMPTDARYDDFDLRSLKAGGLTVPDVIHLATPIPGSAPAIADVTITHAGGGYLTGFSAPAAPIAGGPPVFALLGWAAAAAPFNIVWNGDFEDDPVGATPRNWGIGGLTGVAQAATSNVRVSDPARAKFGVASMLVVTTATSGSGVVHQITRRFKAGVPYTATVWASAPSSTTSMKIVLGTATDQAVSASTPALSPTIQQYTATWTPTADRDFAFIAFETNAATVTTFNMDGVVVYEGTVAPTLGRHAEGAGARPPMGIIEATDNDQADQTSSWVSNTTTEYLNKWALVDTATAGIETYDAGWWVDPSLLLADAFADGEVDIEFWARVRLDPTNFAPRATLSARPDGTQNVVVGTSSGPVNTFAAERYTAEYGRTGRALVLPSGTVGQTVWRFVRMGTLTFPVDLSRPARWKLRFEASVGAGSGGSFALDYLLACPIRSRALTPTGKVQDSSYPNFISTPAETAKMVTSELRGYSSRGPRPSGPDSGLGGSIIELPPARVDAVLKLSSLVPDDPTFTNSSEQLYHLATLHFDVTPRVYLVKGG